MEKEIKIEAEGIPVVELPKEEAEDLKCLLRLVPPHKKASREVTEKDIERVIEESKVLHEICFKPNGMYKGAYAMHHSQIDEKDPMSLFVTWDRQIILNVKITKHSGYTVDSLEACMSYSDRPQITVPRWHKLEVEFVTIMVDPENKDKFKLSGVQKLKLAGHQSFIFQHEIDHGNAQFIFQ
jgi:predicted metalloprotease